MKAHSKRALLDCLKYIGIIYHDEYVEFMKRYESVDLTYINNGNFIRDAVKLYNESVDWNNNWCTCSYFPSNKKTRCQTPLQN